MREVLRKRDTLHFGDKSNDGHVEVINVEEIRVKRPKGIHEVRHDNILGILIEENLKSVRARSFVST